MPKKSYREYRLEAEALNQAASEKGKPAPISEYASLRKEPLAKQVIEVRVNNYLNGGGSQHG